MRSERTGTAAHRGLVGIQSLLSVVWAFVALAAQTPAASPPASQPPSPPPAQTPAAPPSAAAAPATPSTTAAPAGAEAAAGAQPAAPAPVVTTALTFTTPAAALLASIKPDKVADYESLLVSFVDALKKSPDPAHQQMAASLRVYRATEPAPGGANTLYVLVIDPVVPEADYSWQALLGRIYAAFPGQAQAVFEKGTSVHAGPMNRLSLTPVPLVPAPEGQAPQTPQPPAPGATPAEPATGGTPKPAAPAPAPPVPGPKNPPG